MAPLLEDPRFRQTWNQFSQNAEHATESAAAGIWTFQHRYLNPCLSSVSSSFTHCTGHCFPDRSARGRTRGRAELSFDFYDDWDQENNGGERQGLLGGWGNDELDRLLSGTGPGDQPRRKRGMSYGTGGAGGSGRPRRRKSQDLRDDPTVIPSTSALGFLGRLPFKLGGTLRYKPSAADLQEHPGARSEDFRAVGEDGEDEGEPLITDEDDEGKGHQRQRSSTASSEETLDSFRSRGDLFPSDGEDDAVPLPDEFAMVLERRTTISNMDDRSSGKTRSSKGKRPAGSRTTSRTLSRTAASSQSRPSLDGQHTSSGPQTPGLPSPDVKIPSLTDLQQEDERLRLEEDAEVERKREAAAKLAAERGLRKDDVIEAMAESKTDASVVEAIPAPEDIDIKEAQASDEVSAKSREKEPMSESPPKEPRDQEFVPARLPNFG
ncbi:hypothetical protein LHYA1_G004048 [Lachnellula hyalina]|uniref:Uncharacterized protein n=1 Tax=Lachnellula hyalina TaxID=1316788 RepID=A0A8H8R322_9HELO|nr:uncharacterized protein LHYA1_G004048 [Lachnellula hyalina]TVY27598.1 hypothetical protein LHYA1_G004048 [Lachnellula hyalina]